MIYKVVLHRSNEGYSVNCPGLYLAVAESRQSGTSQHVAHQHER
jgi:hypothetical protein